MSESGSKGLGLKAVSLIHTSSALPRARSRLRTKHARRGSPHANPVMDMIARRPQQYLAGPGRLRLPLPKPTISVGATGLPSASRNAAATSATCAMRLNISRRSHDSHSEVVPWYTQPQLRQRRLDGAVEGFGELDALVPGYVADHSQELGVRVSRRNPGFHSAQPTLQRAS
jgi:hypothetical protein